MYHPDYINQNMIKLSPAPDNRTKNLSYNMYNYYLYELLILEFTIRLNKDKNQSIRNKIDKELVNIDRDSDAVIKNIASHIEKYYTDMGLEININDDMQIILTYINEYISTHKNKQRLINNINSIFYTFDKVHINQFKLLSKSDIVKELKKISKNIVEITPESDIKKKITNSEFPNMLESCHHNMNYCKNKKLIITNKKLNELLEIMASDILNPFKEKYFFDTAFVNNIVSFFKFKKRGYETITITSL